MNDDTHQYQLLPDLPADDYERLKADIAERGVLVAVELDEHGNVLDGHHRVRIATELGVDYPTVVRSGLAEHEKRLHAVALNLARRHLTDAQKVLLGMTIEDDVAAEAKKRMADGGRGGQVSTPSPAKVEDKTRDEVARRVGLNKGPGQKAGRTYERAKATIAKAEKVAPEVAVKAKAGELTMREVAKQVRQVEKAQKVAEIRSRPVPKLDATGPWPVIYADPPWRYEHAEPSRSLDNQYPTMTLEDICAMRVPAADDAVLFLWATSPKLTEALQVMSAWGFEYRTCMVWVKDRIGMGYYARQRHEILLIGRRGNLPVPEPSDRPDSVIEAPLGRHSEKPAEFAETIARMYPHLPKVELFARQARLGWDAWGNEAAA
jgi:N6-adenosine-specific RNA methylase IME4